MPTLSDIFPPYQMPRPCLGRCRHCGAMVIGRRWNAHTHAYEEVQPRRSPVTGMAHACQKTDRASDADTSDALRNPQ